MCSTAGASSHVVDLDCGHLLARGGAAEALLDLKVAEDLHTKARRMPHTQRARAFELSFQAVRTPTANIQT